jgi:hypothetical protein
MRKSTARFVETLTGCGLSAGCEVRLVRHHRASHSDRALYWAVELVGPGGLVIGFEQTAMPGDQSPGPALDEARALAEALRGSGIECMLGS